MSIDIDKFDFGFTVVDENELEAVQKLSTEASTVAASAEQNEEKLNKLYNAILPLLSNLKMNPEKDYIYWPNRTEKVEAFEELIAGIIK
jgi:carbohydrate-selective porin OprB